MIFNRYQRASIRFNILSWVSRVFNIPIMTARQKCKNPIGAGPKLVKLNTHGETRFLGWFPDDTFRK